MMDKEGKDSHNIFLHIANNFGFSCESNNQSSSIPVDYGKILLSISSAQEDIELLKQKLRIGDVTRDYDADGCTHSLKSLLTSFNTKLRCLLAETGSIENKLSNPVIKNSIPLEASSQQDLIQATVDIANVVENADRLLGKEMFHSNASNSCFSRNCCTKIVYHTVYNIPTIQLFFFI